MSGRNTEGSDNISYSDFLASKSITAATVGMEVDELHPTLFDFQKDLVRWALRKGRSAIFADTGLGKTFMQLEWARHQKDWTLILAPLSVAQQTVGESSKLGVDAIYARSQEEVTDAPVVVTNYEMVDHFDPTFFGAVVLDESSILKAYDGKTRTKLIETFSSTPYRLCCTATPAPNDIAEIANHAEFLGIMSRVEMLATFFVHDDQGWRLKRHATQPFYRWLASWGMTLKRPSDLGYSDEGFDLPPLTTHVHAVDAGYVPEGQLFSTGLKGVTDRQKVRKGTLEDRVEEAAKLIESDDQPWIAWVGLNDEGRALRDRLLIHDPILMEGADSIDAKARAIDDFASGRKRILITKTSMAGFGLNLQHCARMAFVGLNDSYEAFYQAVRRCWRYGQANPVEAHVVISDAEMPVYQNVLRKEQEAATMQSELVKNVQEFEKSEIGKAGTETFEYRTDDEWGDGWHLRLGDSIERIKEVGTDSIDLSIFSPPFQSLYTYSATERDLGNSGSSEEFWTHFSFLIDDLLRVTKPGRNVCVHVANIATTLNHDGVIGLYDFRGDTIRAFVKQGFTYHGEVCIDKNPQSQAIRTHAKGLLFAQKERDASWLRPALADYILVFKKPGDNAVPVKSDVTNEEWIDFAHPVWYGIRETETLNVAEARSEEDERHICPLQLGAIDRCVRLWSNPGETVLSPFAGIGSEGYQSLLRGRQFVGIELKPEYYKTAVRNLRRAEAEAKAETLFGQTEAA